MQWIHFQLHEVKEASNVSFSSIEDIVKKSRAVLRLHEKDLT